LRKKQEKSRLETQRSSLIEVWHTSLGKIFIKVHIHPRRNLTSRPHEGCVEWMNKSGSPNTLAYNAANFAVVGMTQSMARELGPNG